MIEITEQGHGCGPQTYLRNNSCYMWTAVYSRKLGDVLALRNSRFQRAWTWGVKVKGGWDPSAGHNTITSIHFLPCHCTHVPGQPSSRKRFRSTLQQINPNTPPRTPASSPTHSKKKVSCTQMKQTLLSSLQHSQALVINGKCFVCLQASCPLFNMCFKLLDPPSPRPGKPQGMSS